jgi:hypothetical protein
MHVVSAQQPASERKKKIKAVFEFDIHDKERFEERAWQFFKLSDFQYFRKTDGL